MKDRIDCLRCHTPMELGFIAVAKDGAGTAQEQWGPGPAKSTFWKGLVTDRKTLLPVTTLRCPKCGALESYAHPKATR